MRGRRAVVLMVLSVSTCVATGCTGRVHLSDDGSAGTCMESDAAEPDFPIAKSNDRALVNDGFLERLTGWRYVEEHRSVETGSTPKRQSAILTGGAARDDRSGGVQALYVGTDAQEPWSEFLWQSPQWSQRDARSPTWVTRTEAGAFEPSYQFAYFTQLSFASTFAPLFEDRVFEGALNINGRHLLRYCVENPPSSVAARGSPGIARFVIDPDGYVTEWVQSHSGDGLLECQEITLSISPELSVQGLHDDLPGEWLTTLSYLPSCRQMYEARPSDVS